MSVAAKIMCSPAVKGGCLHSIRMVVAVYITLLPAAWCNLPVKADVNIVLLGTLQLTYVGVSDLMKDLSCKIRHRGHVL